MFRLIFLLLLLLFSLDNASCQQERKLVREGVKEYNKGKFTDAEIKYRKALDAKPGLYEAEYDVANTLYKQNKYKEAANEYERLLQERNDPVQRADLFHNLGNSQLMAQQYDKSVEAYKNSLRIRPDDEDTRYNLAYALQKLKEQQQQKQDQKEQDKNQDKDNQQKDQNQDKQDQNKNDQQKQDQQEQQDKNSGQQEGNEQKVSKQELEQLLNAIQNQEKQVKEKVDKKKAVAKPVRTDKDW